MRRFRLYGLVLSLSLLCGAAAAQVPADSLRTELIRSRGFLRAAETQLTKSLAILDAPASPPPPPAVVDWRTGEWSVRAGGYEGVIDLDARSAGWEGVTAPVEIAFVGDILEVKLDVPGFGVGGLLSLVHAEGRMIGTVTYEGEERPASAWRENLQVVRTVQEGECTFAEFTDGSWGVSPFTGTCHDHLNTYVGGMKFVARTFNP